MTEELFHRLTCPLRKKQQNKQTTNMNEITFFYNSN